MRFSIALLGVAFCLWVWVQPVRAIEVPNAPCYQPPTAIVFGNGMFNTREDAEDASKELRRVLLDAAALENAGPLEFHLAYNQSEGLLEQVFEVLLQRGLDEWYIGPIGWLAFNTDWLPDVFEELHHAFAQAGYRRELDDVDLRQHLALYTQLLDEDARIVTVAHSQGNLYANRAYELLQGGYEANAELAAFAGTEAKRMALVSLATPAAYVADGSEHLTFRQDRVIELVRRALPSTLPANASLVDASRDATGHAFAGYLEDAGGQPRLLKRIRSALETTVTGTPAEHEAIVFAQLESSHELPVSLWVQDINGSQAWSYPEATVPAGQEGAFVLASATASEYELDCAQLEQGSYTFGIQLEGEVAEGAQANVLMVVTAGEEFYYADLEITGPYPAWSQPRWYIELDTFTDAAGARQFIFTQLIEDSFETAGAMNESSALGTLDAAQQSLRGPVGRLRVSTAQSSTR